MEILLIILSLLLAAAAYTIYVLAAKSAAARNKSLLAEQNCVHLSEQLDAARADNERIGKSLGDLQEQYSELRSRYAASREQTAALTRELETEKNESGQRFKSIADQVLKETSKEMKTSGEQRISEILSPLAKNIDEFRKFMTDSFRSEAEGRATLKAHIETLRDINSTIGKEARELTIALRGNSKIQGDWGEMILTTLLEKSGLQEGIHYTVQQTRDDENRTLRGDEGRLLRPDVVICYPDGKKIVIDSKVSLTAFTEMVNAEDENSRNIFRAQHLKSVRKHVDELSSKDYPKAIGSDVSADFALMFIPHEPAYLAAMESDNSLWEYAYSRRVVIVSPTHLLSVLRLLSQVWQQDKINRNTLRIAEESGKMLDVLFSFKDDMDNIEKALENARAAHDKAIKHLFTGNGNVAKRASTLLELGAKAKKSLPKSWEEENND